MWDYIKFTDYSSKSIILRPIGLDSCPRLVQLVGNDQGALLVDGDDFLAFQGVDDWLDVGRRDMEELLQEALERRFGLRQHTPRTQIGGNGSGHVATERLAGGDVGGEKPVLGNECLELGLVVPDRTAGSAHIDLDGLLPGGDTDDSHLFAATRTRTTRRLQALRARHNLSETLLIENTTQRTDCRRHTAALRTGSASQHRCAVLTDLGI